MGARIINTSGNGAILDDSLIGWSYSEEVTSLEPGNIKGATGQVSIRAIERTEDKLGNTHPNTKLMINNQVSLIEDDYGIIDLQVKSISTNAGVASITADTLQWKLNVTKTALAVPNLKEPVAGNLFAAINYYCGLVGIVPEIDSALTAELTTIPVNFIGWTGNLWERLKMLCAVASSSLTTTSRIEMFVGTNGLGFRKALTTDAGIEELKSDYSISVSSNEPAKKVDVALYKTSFGEDKVVYEQSNYDEGKDESQKFLASISDAMQVNAGETVTKRFKINATLESINQPDCVSEITRTFPAPYIGTIGQYVIVGTDNLPILPAQWVGEGGSVKLALTDVPDEIEITVTAPKLDAIEQTSGGTAFAPYKIGVEVADDAEYPAFWITGTGVFFEKKTKTFITGAPEEFAPADSAASIDNIFITTDDQASFNGVAAAQVLCGPSVKMSASIAQGGAFGSSIGSVESNSSNKFRIESASYSESSVSLEASNCARVSDFNAKWSGKTFADFTGIALDPATYEDESLRFNEFTVIPLMEAN